MTITTKAEQRTLRQHGYEYTGSGWLTPTKGVITEAEAKAVAKSLTPKMRTFEKVRDKPPK
jgi:hypothetical protein